MTAGVTTKNEIIQNKKLAEELHKPIIRKFGERKVHLRKVFVFLLCAIDIYSKYAWVIPLKDKKGITITSTFKKH